MATEYLQNLVAITEKCNAKTCTMNDRYINELILLLVWGQIQKREFETLTCGIQRQVYHDPVDYHVLYEERLSVV